MVRKDFNWNTIQENLVKKLIEIRMNFKDSLVPRSQLTVPAMLNPSGDKASKLDQQIEAAIIQALQEDYSGLVISEEREVHHIGEQTTNKQLFFIIDPLDGSRNSFRGIPFSSISLAVGPYFSEDNATNKKRNKIRLSSIKLGIVVDLFTGDYYYALRDQGAYKNEDNITTSDYYKDTTSLVCLYGHHAADRFQNVVNTIIKTEKVRVLGSIALELCLIADGTLDAMIDVRGKSRSVDFAAGMLIASEAGGAFKFLKKRQERILGIEDDIQLDNAIDGYSYVVANSASLLDKFLQLIDNR